MVASESIRIDWAQHSDAAALVPVLTALHRHDVADAGELTPDIVLRHAIRLLDPEAPHRLAVAWDATGCPLALAAVATWFSISDPRSDRRVQAEVKELFVMPDHRGAGIGEALMNWIESAAIGAGAWRMDWHVKKDNAGGIAFYERNGATIVENRLSMRKILLR